MRYDVRLRSPDGRTYTRTFRTKREADAYQAQKVVDRNRGIWVDPGGARRTVRDVCDEWLLSNPGKRASTYARDESVLRQHVLPVIGSRRIGAVTKTDVQQLVNSRAAIVRPSTVEREYGVVRAVFRYAVDAEYIGRSPCRNINLPQIRTRERMVVSPSDVARLSDALGPEYGLMADLGAVLGMRWGEVAGLRVGRINLLRRMLSVEEQLTRGAHGRQVFAPPKSQDGHRTPRIGPGLSARIADHLARRGLTGAEREALVFTRPAGGPLSYAHWRQRVWLPATKAAGLAGLQFHDLRATNATALIAKGVDPKTVAKRLGHSDERLTLALYAQATSQADEAAADALDRHFFGGEDDGRAMDAR